MQTHSLSQAATLLGVHRNTLHQWLQHGCPAVEKADRERGVEWQISLPDIVDWRIERAVANVAAASRGDGTAIPKDEADRRRAVALALSAEIDLDERTRNVVARADAVADMSAFCQALRDQISSAFGKIASRCSTMQLPTEIEAMCRAEWNRAMKVAQEELRRRWDLRMAGEAVTDFPTE